LIIIITTIIIITPMISLGKGARAVSLGKEANSEGGVRMGIEG
jgi:hypothetical protein